MPEDNNANWWKEKKKPLVSNLGEMIDTRKTLLTNFAGIQKNCQEAVDNVNGDIDRLDQMRKIFSSNAYLAKNPAFEGSIDQLIGMSSFDVRFQRELLSKAGALATNMDAFAGARILNGSVALNECGVFAGITNMSPTFKSEELPATVASASPSRIKIKAS